jgi:hypothetical protein
MGMERMLYKIAFSALLTCGTLMVHAQGDVVIHADPRLEQLFKKKHSSTREVAATVVSTPQPEQRLAMDLKRSSEVKRTAAIKSVADPKLLTGDTKQPPTEVKRPLASNFVIPPASRRNGPVYTGKGFRVQIYNGQDREKAIKIKTEFMRRYPGIRTYLSYVSPSFRVKVGDFRRRGDAEGMLREANSVYSPCMIVPDMITSF